MEKAPRLRFNFRPKQSKAVMKFVLLFLIIITVSCGNEKVPKSEAARPKDTTIIKNKLRKPEPIKKKVIPLINDKNVEEKLLEYGAKNPESIVKIYTTFGLIKARLYKDTPLHRASFLLWAKSGFYSNSLFMRCTPNFIAQGGTTNSDRQLEIKEKIGKYTIPSEFHHHRFHKKGALGMARHYDDNPKKRSDSHRFYFVEGTTYNRPTLTHYEKAQNYKYSTAQLDYYTGGNLGAAHIDGEHTVFGEVISGLSVVKKLTEVETDSRDWPLQDIFIDSVVVVR